MEKKGKESSLGERLRLFRKAKGLSQKELSAIVGYSDSALSKHERGESLPDVELGHRLAQFYGVTVEMLISGREGSRENEIDSLYRQLHHAQVLVARYQAILKKIEGIIREEGEALQLLDSVFDDEKEE